MLVRSNSQPKTIRRGASRKQSDARSRVKIPWAALRKVSVALLVAASLGLCWIYGSDVVASVVNRPIAKVGIEGDFRFIEKNNIADIVAGHINQEFVQLDLQEIKAQLELQPWIDTVSLTRRWPDRLFVRIDEQQPIARWGSKGFINQRGELIYVPVNDYLKTLPLLSADDSMAEQMMQSYLALNKLLRPKMLEVTALTCDGKRSWSLVLSNGIEVKLGRDEMFLKLQRVLAVYEHYLKQRVDEVATIDARYEQGVAVAWKQPGENTIAKKNT